MSTFTRLLLGFVAGQVPACPSAFDPKRSIAAALQLAKVRRWRQFSVPLRNDAVCQSRRCGDTCYTSESYPRRLAPRQPGDIPLALITVVAAGDLR